MKEIMTEILEVQNAFAKARVAAIDHGCTSDICDELTSVWINLSEDFKDEYGYDLTQHLQPYRILKAVEASRKNTDTDGGEG